MLSNILANTVFRVLLVTTAALSLSGCEVIGDIFKAGMWTGVLVVIAVIVGLVMLFMRAKK